MKNISYYENRVTDKKIEAVHFYEIIDGQKESVEATKEEIADACHHISWCHTEGRSNNNYNKKWEVIIFHKIDLK